ncbi:MAG: diacylglycerol kinase family lipid kinase [Lachnospiraceae bacterium]|nr:diacylglycerol kinase family lipid kinase [Lachnospiraceae bacterium]
MYHIIVNPASRSGKGIQIWKQTIEPALKTRQVDYQVYFSLAEGDVAKLAQQILLQYPEETLTFIVLGGDGTVNEFLQGAHDLSRVKLGYIPSGSSNDLARDLCIPKNPADALDVILNHTQSTPMDVGQVTLADGNTIRFAVSCGIGYDANVCEEVAHSKLKKALNRIGLGKLTYLGIALKQIFTSRFVDCTLTLDGGTPISMKRLIFIASMIHRYEGGGFMFCPDADPADGVLNLCTARNLPKPVIPFILPTAFWGKHFFFKNVDAFKGHEIVIEAPVELWVHTDGEARYKSSRITVSCLPGAIKMIF